MTSLVDNITPTYGPYGFWWSKVLGKNGMKERSRVSSASSRGFLRHVFDLVTCKRVVKQDFVCCKKRPSDLPRFKALRSGSSRFDPIRTRSNFQLF